MDIGPHLEALELELRSLFEERDPVHARLYGMMGYHLGWLDAAFNPVSASAGKRIRPLLCLFAAEAASAPWERALPAAAAVELLHNFSLVHDDIQDRSGSRRHRSTVWKLWGEAQAINVGDALFSLAYFALQQLSGQIDPATVTRATEELAKTCLALCEGQFLDLHFEEVPAVSEDEYLIMARGKTAALIGYSTYVGALVGVGDGETAAAYRRFGEEIGMAFQMVDDLLGIWGREEITGKPVADDVKSKKKTLPIIHALTHASAEARAQLWQVLQSESLTEGDVRIVVGLLEEAGAESYVRTKAVKYRKRALEALDRASATGGGRDRLRELALSMIDREH